MPPVDRYAAERYNPTLAHCNSLRLLFNGKDLILFKSDKESFSFPAVSGRPDAAARFNYSADSQRQASKGPIPEGTYWVRPDELWENAWYKAGSYNAWGKYRLTIHPFNTTATASRGGFFIHGGATPGSAGCIDLANWIDHFVSELKHQLGGKTDCQIHLTVAYPKKGP